MRKVAIRGFRLDSAPIPTKVYDVEAKKLLGVFESRLAAANFLGVKHSQVSMAFKRKGRIHTNKLGKVVCIR